MRVACRTLALAVGLAVAFDPARAAADPTDELLARLALCQHALDPELDVGYRRVAQRCPRLIGELTGSDWAAFLPARWDERDNDLSAGGLAELARLIEHERAASARATTASAHLAPSRAILASVLRELGPAGDAEGGLWSRLTRWLRSLLETHDEAPGSSWMSRLMRRIDPGDAVMRVLGYAALALIVALAIVIVANELRAAGLLRAPRRRAARREVAEAGATTASPQRHELTRVALVERPALLLRIVIDALNRTRRLPPAGSLTAREISATARVDSPEDRARLILLASAAERARFAASAPAASDLVPVLAGGESLLAGLEREAEGR